MSAKKMKEGKKPLQKIMLATLAMSLLSAIPFSSQAAPGDRERAKRIHDRIAGVPPTAAVLDAMEACITGNSAVCIAGGGDPTISTDGAVVAAYVAMENSSFYNVTLKNFAAPWTNEAQTVFVPLNDYTATVIGMIRDDLDFRGILSDDIIYIGSTTTPGYRNNDNTHYTTMENAGKDLKTELVRRTQTAVTGIPAAAGIFSLRASARAFYIDGTNRAMFRFTLMNHLCTDLEPLKDNSRAHDRVRQDVTRSPGGDSRLFMNSCVGCHAGMDPLAQALAYYEWSYTTDPDTGQLTYSTTQRAVDPNDSSKGMTRAQPKYLINSGNFKYGYVTRNDSWDNYWRSGPNAILGWSSSVASSGQGASSMGRELANSKAFSSCQARKVFQNVCLRDPMSNAADRTKINQIVNSMTNGVVNMKRIFAETASYCKDGSQY